MWLKSFEDDYAAQVRVRSLLGHLVCSEEIPADILELNIFRILESENVTDIGALHEISKFILIFEYPYSKNCSYSNTHPKKI